MLKGGLHWKIWELNSERKLGIRDDKIIFTVISNQPLGIQSPQNINVPRLVYSLDFKYRDFTIGISKQNIDSIK